MKNIRKRKIAKLLAAAMVISQITIPQEVVSAASEWEGSPTFSFSDAKITVEGAESDAYTIEETAPTALTINKAGTYILTGDCADGSVVVSKKVTEVVLVLDGLDLTSASTAPIQCKKSTEVEIIAAEGTENSLTDAAANAENEKAVIKSGDGSTLTLSGTGTVNVTANGKNGIKGGAETAVIVKEQTLNITALDNALASDGSVTIDSGTITIASTEGDGIKSSPDEGDTASAGTITLNGGTVNIQQASDGIQAFNAITIHGGNYAVVSADNAIKSDLSVEMDGGKLDLKAGGDGIKASNMTGTDTTTEAGTTSTDTTTSDGTAGDTVTEEDTTTETTATGDITIRAGEIAIDAAGDGIQPEIHVAKAYEGLEGGTVYVYGGEIEVVSSDDGINAAGGSSNGTETALLRLRVEKALREAVNMLFISMVES